MIDNFSQLNGIALAYMGDAAYEVFIRRHLIAQGLTKPKRLQHVATNYVSAKAQAALIDLMKTDGLLNETEWDYFKRGRNANSHTHAKNTDVITYRISTGFEAVFGYLSLSDQTDRMKEIANWCIEQVESGNLKHEE
ncbi:Mini-ribonuclease 3 [Lentilactobacillus buchneri]|uniref:Mini-ribonuclease 3 n=2 Tax=Lentilactobacillus buchneri TaxID=1581 RepID=J9W2H1_LENBU|nr:Mini-ribonuclease 3 [Lentilactobacillus buchneri]MCC6099983.1 Mini-ribonuclease 3 [Lactobacillus sp.]WCJ52037.1 Mini-ribonuclease 3 [Lentilactobacillus sp. Egmn17]AEB73725.1 ribonuclease III [Lentilactobacillus buchneri NRRL B-30929]AFS00554.1 ribonuclease III [Lentilactobacillus buchneri subsp. silagei CD034]KRK67896.1 ribonuclease III [Lentilactobacillus buchneri DSM 20057]